MNLLQVVPYLAPSISGVGDYAMILARGMREQHGIVTTFAVANSEGSPAVREIDGFKIFSLMDSSVLGCGGFDNFLLHYVGYGYEKRGCPVWLLRELKALKLGNSSASLVTMFHELYAIGLPWQSSFWTSPLQRWICRDLARLSDEIVTNRAGSAEILRRMARRADVSNLPVFSNVGEPAKRTPVKDREPWLVLFGGKEWRTIAWVRDRGEIVAACRKWGIQEVIEIGAGETPEVDLGIPIRRLGKLPVEDVSDWLSRSRLGFISYPSTYLEKSGIFAAYAAHGVVPVLPQRSMVPETLGVIENQHYISPIEGDTSMNFLEERSRDVHAWYQGHQISEHARTFAKLLQR